MSEKKEFKTLDVGATERVDWKVAQGLNKYMHFDKDGDAVIGKNLEIKGNTFDGLLLRFDALKILFCYLLFCLLKITKYSSYSCKHF